MTLWLSNAVLIALFGGGAYYLMTTLMQRAQLARRMSLAIGTGRSSQRELRMAQSALQISSSIGRVAAALGRFLPLGEGDRHKIEVNLRRAGFHTSNAVATMLGIKFSCLLGGFVVGMTFSAVYFSGMLVFFGGLIGGVFTGVLLNIIPEWILKRLANNRIRRINDALAETFDLLVVCLESGLTFDRALTRTVDNLRSIQPDLAFEFGQAALDISIHGRTREDALTRLAERLDSQNFNDLATTVSQSERHGTPLADSLRKLASSVRVESIGRMQEKTARLPTLLIIPSIACILPGILVIVGGPAFVQLTKNLSTFGGGG